MPKRSSSSEDPNTLASRIVREVTVDKPPEKPKDPLAVELGRRGGLKGGKARAEKLTPERRTRIARKAAKARWSHKRQSS